MPLMTVSSEPLFFAAINAIKELAIKDSLQQQKIDSLVTVVSQCCAAPLSRKTNNNSNGDEGLDKAKGKEEIPNELIRVNLSSIYSPILYQNEPNPFGEGTTIRYFIPYESGSAYVIFHDEFGREIEKVNISQKGYGQFEISSKNLASGVYSYSLFINEKLIDSKKMIRSK